MKCLIPIVLIFAGGLANGAIRAGAFEVDITPAEFPIMISGGFLAKQMTAADGRLHARAIVLDDGSKRIAIAVADSLMIPRELIDRVKVRAAAITGIPIERMLISATHTHSAPPVMGALGTDENPEYSLFFESKLVDAIAGAAKRMTPAKIGWTVVKDWEHTHNRRWILRPDKIRNDPFGEPTVRAYMHPGYQNPEFVGPSGPVDPDFTILSIQRLNGQPLAVLANYSMHYVGAQIKGVSADYFGIFCEQLRTKMFPGGGGDDFVPIISQGTSGDLHYMDYSQPRVDVVTEKYAEELATQAVRAMDAIRYSESVPLDLQQSTMTFVRRLPSRQKLEWAAPLMAKIIPAAPSNQAEVYAREQMYIATTPRRELILQAVRIGNLGIAAIPDEVYALTGLKIKARSPFAHTMNIELANGAEGYIPPPDQHRLGGYTTWAARTAGLEVDAEPRITEGVLTLLEKAAGKPRRLGAEKQGTYVKAVLAAKPLAYWRGSDVASPSAEDASGNGNHGRYEGGVAFYLDGPASLAFSQDEINRAPHFAGGRMTAELTALPADYTVEMWFYNALLPEVRGVSGYLFARGADCVGLRASGRLFADEIEGRTSVALRTWNHMAIVRKGKSVRVYLNGEATPEIEAPSSSNATALQFGACPDHSETWEGRIDEIAVYGRALSSAEIASRRIRN
jgi:hypothetical protein